MSSSYSSSEATSEPKKKISRPPSGTGEIMHRNESYDEKLSRELQDPEFAQGFLLTLTEGEEGLPLIDALKHTIAKMGVTEFSEVSGIPAGSIGQFLNGTRKPKPETLDQYLKPFRLKVKVVAERVA